jgi:immune inhibitor A
MQVRVLNATSTPNSRSYAKKDTFVSITVLSSSGPSMELDCTVKPQASSKFSPRTWYRLQNTLAGFALDVVNDGRGSADGLIQMAREGNFSGQYWQIKENPDGSFGLCTWFLGAEKRLDLFGNDKTKPHLATKDNVTGQIWQITPWGDGSYFLTNSFSGPELSLDTMEGGPRVAMNGRNTGRPTERWTITAIRPITESGF